MTFIPYLIDSDWAIYFLNGREEAINLLSRLSESDELAISIISYIELYQGALVSEASQEAIENLEALVKDSLLLTISPAIARRCAHLRNLLKSQGKNPHRRAYDLIIAATALEHDFILVTNNAKDYVDIPGLHLCSE